MWIDRHINTKNMHDLQKEYGLSPFMDYSAMTSRVSHTSLPGALQER